MVEEGWLAKVPDNLPLDEAAAAPLVSLTAWQVGLQCLCQLVCRLACSQWARQVWSTAGYFDGMLNKYSSPSFMCPHMSSYPSLAGGPGRPQHPQAAVADAR